MHDLDGVAMDHHPLSRKEREEVMEETLRLLRGQGEMKGLNEDGSGHGEQGGRWARREERGREIEQEGKREQFRLYYSFWKNTVMT